jgi:hypothetical protein
MERECKLCKMWKYHWDLFATHCCSGKSPLLGKYVTVSVMGIPPYITFSPETKALGGVDVELFKIIARKFLLRVTLRPEKTWLDKLDNGTLIGTVASVSLPNFFKNLTLNSGSIVDLKY